MSEATLAELSELQSIDALIVGAGFAGMQANNWYMGANVPGKPRMFMPYVGGLKLTLRFAAK